MEGLNPAECLPPLTAYYVMKIGRLPLIPYYRPGAMPYPLLRRME
jgi:hypothetical protein